jgi:RimJ/RimL family protein N-acetyltransferase
MPHIKTERLTLYIGAYHRKFRPDIHIEWLNNKELMKYSEQRHRRHTLESQRKYLASFDHAASFLWEIYITDHLVPIGTITAFCDWRNKVADLGILIGEFRGKGYGSEAWTAICEWLFKKGYRKIEAGCMASNAAMIKIFGKTGMVIEGRRRSHFLLDGKPEDLILAARFELAIASK